MADESIPGLVFRGERDEEVFRDFDQAEPGSDTESPEGSPEGGPGFMETTKVLMGENHIYPSFLRLQDRDPSVDPDYDGSEERIQKDLDDLGLDIPEDWYAEFALVNNDDEHQRVLRRMEERLAINEQVAELGGAKAVGAHLASYATDPAGFLIDLVTGAGTKGRAIHRFFSAGARATGAEVAIEAALAADGETVRPEDVAAGFSAAFLVGGGLGAAFGRMTPQEQAAFDEFQRTIRRSQNEGGEDASDSVGAARVPFLPDNPLTREKVDNLDNLRIEVAGGERAIPRGQEPALVKGRIGSLANAWRRARDNQAQKRMILDFLSNPTQKRADEINEAAGEEIAERLFGGVEGARMRTTNSAFRDWLKETHGMGRARRAGVAVFRGGKYANLKEQFNTDVHRYITSEGSEDVADSVRRAADAHLEEMQTWRKRLIDNGVATEEQLSKSKWWFPRMMDRTKARGFAYARGGRQDLVDAFEMALRRGREKRGLEVDDKTNKLVANAYVSRLLDTADDGRFNEVDVKYLEEYDRDDILEMLEEAGVKDEDYQHALELLDRGVKRGDSPNDELPDHLKTRLPLDMETPLSDGRVLGDLFENDVEKIAWRYGKWAAGEIALHQKGYTSKGVTRMIAEAREEAAKNKGRPGGPDRRAFTEKQVKDLEFAFNRVMGRSLDAGWDPDIARAARVATGVGYSSKMGSGGINALVESAAALAYFGIGRSIRNIPAMREIMREVRGKTPNKPLTRQLTMLTGGIGQTLGRQTYAARHEASQIVRRSPDAADFGERLLGRSEDFVEGLKRGASWTNMLSLVTDMSRQMTSVLALEQLDRILVQGKRAPKWFQNRAKSWGLDENGMRTLRKHLEGTNVSRHKNGAITDLGDLPPEVERVLGDYLYRYTAEVIQNVQSGNLPRFMQNPLGRMLLQFRSFTMAALPRHTYKDMKHGDSVGALKLIYTGSFAALTYMGRQIAFTADEDRRERNLKPDKIVEGALRYAVNVSVMPEVLSTAADVVAGEPLFEGVRTSGLGTSLMSSFPAMAYGEDAMAVSSGIVDFARSGFEKDSISKGQFSALTNILMLDTLWATRPIVNRLAEQFPSEAEADEARNSVDIMEEFGLKEEE